MDVQFKCPTLPQLNNVKRKLSVDISWGDAIKETVGVGQPFYTVNHEMSRDKLIYVGGYQPPEVLPKEGKWSQAQPRRTCKLIVLVYHSLKLMTD